MNNNKKKLGSMKKKYMDIEIPEELDSIVKDALYGKSKISKFKMMKNVGVMCASLAVCVLSINVSPAFADTVEKIPIIGNIVKVVKLSNYSVNEDGFEVSIDVPKIEGMKDKNLEAKLNREMEKDAKNLYNQYLAEIEEFKKDNLPAHEMVKSWYEVKTDNSKVLSLVIYEHHAQGSSNTTRKFYNIDKENETAITLKTIFRNKDYVNIISGNIKEQMAKNVSEDPNKSYWINSDVEGLDFEKIKENQGFYINENNELVICFDKYEIAPGYMGLVEFKIPNEVVEKML
ncbi:MAG: anti-sigma-V factor rsiV [Romboutsia sp.]